MWTKTYAMSKKETTVLSKENEPFKYSALFNFEGKKDPLIVQLVAKGCCPRVKLSE